MIKIHAMTCDPGARVHASNLGPCSFAYCVACDEMGAEPYPIAVGVVAMSGGALDNLAAWFIPVIFATVVRAGKTADEFWSDVREWKRKQADEENVDT